MTTSKIDQTHREIKFRFWSVAGMHDVESIDFKNSLVFLSDGDERQLDSGTLMQYTGLKDKNGKEIYEGDIVDCHKIYSNGDDCVRQVVIKDIRKLPDELFKGSNDGYREIVGNIYENPELLSN